MYSRSCTFRYPYTHIAVFFLYMTHFHFEYSCTRSSVLLDTQIAIYSDTRPTYPTSHSYLAISLSQPTSCPPRPLLPATPSGQFGHFSLTHSGHSLTSSLSHIFSSPLPYDLMFPSFYYSKKIYDDALNIFFLFS